MTKAQKDQYWLDCIQKCRVSGLSDYAWCHQHNVSTSSFYYNIKRLRRKASVVPASVPKVVEKQEVVPVHYNELSEKKYLIRIIHRILSQSVLNFMVSLWQSAMMQMAPLSEQRFLRCSSCVR